MREFQISVVRHHIQKRFLPLRLELTVYIFHNSSPEELDHFIAPEYGCIAPLRLLLLKQYDPVTWDRLEMLMDHDAERKTETEYQKMFQVILVELIFI